METKEYNTISNRYENWRGDVNESPNAENAALLAMEFMQRAICSLGLFIEDEKVDIVERMKMYGYFRVLRAIDEALQDDSDMWNPKYDPSK